MTENKKTDMNWFSLNLIHLIGTKYSEFDAFGLSFQMSEQFK